MAATDVKVTALFLPGLSDANLCKNNQKTGHIICADVNIFIIKYQHMLFVLFVCFCLFLHKLASNKPSKNWAPTYVNDFIDFLSTELFGLWMCSVLAFRIV